VEHVRISDLAPSSRKSEQDLQGLEIAAPQSCNVLEKHGMGNFQAYQKVWRRACLDRFCSSLEQLVFHFLLSLLSML
jgi:hypothetical protein